MKHHFSMLNPFFLVYHDIWEKRETNIKIKIYNKKINVFSFGFG